MVKYLNIYCLLETKSPSCNILSFSITKIAKELAEFRKNNTAQNKSLPKDKTTLFEDVKNKDLWVKLYNLNKSLNIKWNWVKAHAGNPMNEQVDLMAKKAANSD